MAESQENIVVVPVILEVAEVEVEVAVRIRVHVRNPVVAVNESKTCYNISSNITESDTSHSLYFTPSLLWKKLYCSII